MMPFIPVCRALFPSLAALLSLVCSGCAGALPLEKYQDSSGTQAAPVTATVPPDATPPRAAATPTDDGRATGTPAVPRHPRPSRFSGPADSSYRSRTLTEDTTWRGQVLVEGAVTVEPQATLTVTPGTIVRFRPTSGGEPGFLLIRGRIEASGTKEQPITLTSDETGPTAGDWQGIMILDSAKKNLLEWCRIEAADTGVAAAYSELVLRETAASGSRNGMLFRSSSVIVTGGGVSACRTGLSSRDSDLDVSGGIFTGNDRGIVVNGGSLFLSAATLSGTEGSAVEANGARLHLEGNSLVRNGAGALLAGCRGDLVGNRVERNRQGGLDLTGSPLRITGNRITGNDGIGVLVRSGGGTLWENSLEGNGGGDLAVTGTEEVAAPSNWWGSADPARIREQISTGAGGRVFFTPFLEAPHRLQ